MNAKRTLLPGQAAMLEKLRAIDNDPNMPMIDMSVPCTPWMKSKRGKGYGAIRWRGRASYAHRVVYALTRRVSLDDLEGIVVRHCCDNPVCHEFRHLIAGTHADNMADMIGRKRACAGEMKPSAKMTAEQVLAARAEYVPESRLHGSQALARKYGVSAKVMHGILTGSTWKHLPGAHELKRKPAGLSTR